MIFALISLVALTVLSLVLINLLWLKHLRYVTNIAVAQTSRDFATLQTVSDPTIRKPSPKEQNVRPDGL